MKLFRSIIALILMLAFFNVIVGKAVHEVFEHEHHEHTCDVKDKIHFHEFEFTHTDFICDFNINSTDLLGFITSYQVQLDLFQGKVDIIYLWLVKNLFHDLSLQRGPPFNR